MNTDIHKFLSKSIFFDCPQCESTRSATLNDLGSEIRCENCGHIIKIDKRLFVDSDLDNELVQELNEYLKFKDPSA